VAHEIAHNTLGHKTKRIGNILLGSLLDIAVAATTGANTQGAFGRLGGMAFSKGFEAEADYVGLYVAARAGYEIADAPNFWRRMAVEHPGNIKKNFSATHPSAPERFTALEETVRQIEKKRQNGELLMPEKKQGTGRGHEDD
jgi:predicted Zn-dependent protease